MTKIKHIKGQFNEVVFKRDGQEHTVFIIEGLVYTKTRELFTGEITGKHNAKVIEGKFEGKVNSYFSDEDLFYASKEEEPYKGQKYDKKIHVETFYKDGKKNGQYMEYHANGPLHIKTYYYFHTKKLLNETASFLYMYVYTSIIRLNNLF